MTRDDLEKCHDQQQQAATQAANRMKLPKNALISDLAEFSRKVMANVMTGFGAVVNETGSWVDSVPLPFQLMTQPKLTVDLTLETLNSDTPFGLDSLIDVLQRNRLKLRSAAEILCELGPASYADGKEPELDDLISQYNAIESESIDLIAKEKKLARLFTVGAGTMTALPGLGIYFGLGVAMRGSRPRRRPDR